MSERDILKTLTKLVAEEIIFLDRGYGKQKPDALQREYDALQDALRWIHLKTEELNRREYTYE